MQQNAVYKDPKKANLTTDYPTKTRQTKANNKKSKSINLWVSACYVGFFFCFFPASYALPFSCTLFFLCLCFFFFPPPASFFSLFFFRVCFFWICVFLFFFLLSFSDVFSFVLFLFSGLFFCLLIIIFCFCVFQVLVIITVGAVTQRGVFGTLLTFLCSLTYLFGKRYFCILTCKPSSTSCTPVFHSSAKPLGVPSRN